MCVCVLGESLCNMTELSRKVIMGGQNNWQPWVTCKNFNKHKKSVQNPSIPNWPTNSHIKA